jgi:hypothetical protein
MLSVSVMLSLSKHVAHSAPSEHVEDKPATPASTSSCFDKLRVTLGGLFF